ncbi:hypothetical protein [Nonomuraea sp. NPDC023979]|uniref:hypothetical protein n=1 Tax=Nonomuraea sp. NPDC023979 TaxID=3154796 RepID=UPI0033DF9251
MDEEPRPTAQEMIDRLAGPLSPWSRVRAVVALVAGLAGAAFVGALWSSEEALPGRTHLAFALFQAFCLAWAAYGGWLVTRRVPLFATDRVIAAWLAVVASAATTALVAAFTTPPLPALAVGGAFLAAALLLAVRAHTRRAALLRRKHLLERRPAPD